MRDLPETAQQVAADQSGVITARQLARLGVTEDAVRARLDSGAWQRIHTGVFASFSGEPARMTQLWAAVLRVGPGAVLSYQTAAELHGLPRARRQVQVRRGGRSEYRDLVYDSYGVVVETDGRTAHLVTAAWRDAHRDNAAAADGFITLRYSWSDVNGRPCYVARQVAAALTRRGWPGKLRPCSPACTAPAGGHLSRAL